MDPTMLTYFKKFITDTKECMTSGMCAVQLLNNHLEAISKLDFANLSRDKIETTVFFNSLWEAMSHPNGPHWGGVSVLCSAVDDPAVCSFLIENYKFLSILTEILLKSDTSLEQKYKLLHLMEVLSYGVKINWEEPYLIKLMEWLCRGTLESDKSQIRDFFVTLLSILVNLCYGNITVINLLLNTINVKQLIKHLVSRKDTDLGSVQVCRFLMILESVERPPASSDVYNYLRVALQSFAYSIKEINEDELRRVHILINDLCSDPFTKSHVLTYDNFETLLQDALKLTPGLLTNSNASKKCLQITLNILCTFVQLDLFCLRPCHKMIADLCINTCNISELLGPALNLLGIVISQYEEDGMLPDNLMPVISIGLNSLLNPSNIDPRVAGLDWVKFVCALCKCPATRESIFININIEKFENLFKQAIIYYSQISSSKNYYDQELILAGCSICLCFVKRSKQWDACLHRILSLDSVKKGFNLCISNIHNSRRKQFLHIIRHPDFPFERLDEVFSVTTITEGVEISNNNSLQKHVVPSWPNLINSSSPLHVRENTINELIKKLDNLFDNNEVGNVLLNFIELNKYKIAILEQRINSHILSLQSANQMIASQNHTITMLNSMNKSQEDLLYQTQVYNKKLEDNYNRVSGQIDDAEKTIKKFQVKLAAERQDKEQQIANAQYEHEQQIREFRIQSEESNRELESLRIKFEELNNSKNNLLEKLEEQNKKNNDLAKVLSKFEEKIIHKDRKLEEQNRVQVNMKDELEQSKQNIKSLEKTVLERDQRITQLTNQLEEMQRIQEIIANLMGNKSSVSSNSSINN